MDVEVVHEQVNGLCFRVLQGQGDEHLSELKAGTVRRGEREMFPLYVATTSSESQ
jgi:hypothetical protein